MATAAHKPYPPIPYGMANFRAIRREGFLYVDKTRFVRDLENERHVFFLRPRRFGKTCWVSILEHYYDRTRKDGFEALFAGHGHRPRAPPRTAAATRCCGSTSRRSASGWTPWRSASRNTATHS